MKTTNKNTTHNNSKTTKSGYTPPERVRNFFRLKNTLTPKTVSIKSTITGYRPSKEIEMLRIEAEIKQNQGRTYASIIPPR
jgi:hypothetical protein